MQARLSMRDMLTLRLWCEDHLPDIRPLKKYNPTFQGLREDRAQGMCYVFAGGSDDTIFHDERHWAGHILYEYRAWHDSMHLKHNLDFSYESELKLAGILYDEALTMGISEQGARLIELDLALHIQHYYKHNKHPEDQVTMINHALIYGIPKTLEKVW